MSAIDQIIQLVDYFKKERYLKDKTDAMGEGLMLGAQLADESNERSKEATATTKAIQEKYKEQILAQDLNPNKDPELVDLRNGNATAGERITKFENETISQITKTETKIEGFYSLAFFGGIGDFDAENLTGTDDYQAFYDAFEKIKSLGGGVLTIPNGKYFIDTDLPLEIPSNSIIYCSGEVVFPKERINPLFSILHKNKINLYNLKINGSALSESSYSDSALALMLKSSTNIIIDGYEATNLTGDGLYIGRDYDISEAIYCDNVSISNVKIHNAKRNSIALVCGRNIFGKNIVITSDDGEWNTSSALDLEPNNKLESFENIVFEDVSIDANATAILQMNVGEGKVPKLMKNIFFSRVNIKTKGLVPFAVNFNGAGIAENINFNKITIENDVTVGVQVYNVLKNLNVDGVKVESALNHGVLISYNKDNVKLTDFDIKIKVGSTILGNALLLQSNSGKNYDISKMNLDNANRDSYALYINGSLTTDDVKVRDVATVNAPKSAWFRRINRLTYSDNDFSGSVLPDSNTEVRESNNIIDGKYLRTRGTTAQRPTGTATGFEYYDTSLGLPIFWNGTSWANAVGTIV